MRNQFKYVLALAAVMTVAAGCQTMPASQTARDNLRDDSLASAQRFERSDPSLHDVLNRAPGYVVFPSVGKGGFIAGGAYGKGVLYQQGTPVGFADITEATLGFQIGGQDFAELIVFQDNDSLNHFKNNGGYGLSAEASAVVIKPGAAGQAQFKRGVVVFTLINGGLMGEAAVAGQKFRYRDAADETATSYDRAETASNRREPDRTTDADRPHTTNISAGASVSTPDGDAGVSGKTNMSISGSVSTPNGDKNVAAEKTVITTEKERAPRNVEPDVTAK